MHRKLRIWAHLNLSWKTSFLCSGIFPYSTDIRENSGQIKPCVVGFLSSDVHSLLERLSLGIMTRKGSEVQKRSFPLRISSVNVTKSAVFCRLGHIY